MNIMIEYCVINVELFSFLKGSLYVILGNGKRNMATKRSWEIISDMWPAITQAQHSEKPSILKVIDDMINKVDKNMESPAIQTHVFIVFFYNKLHSL